MEAGKKFQVGEEVVADMDTVDGKEEGEGVVDFSEHHNAVKMMMIHIHHDDN